MKREIKFRGKRVDGEWVCGDLIINRPTQAFRIIADGALAKHGDYTADGLHCFGGCVYNVNKSTVGQFTGLKDNNGVNIFEGDILYYRYDDELEADGYGEVYNEVVFKDGAFGVMGEITDDFLSFSCNPIKTEVVAGNIHDNPELLK